jgi:single-strand DNA-binding protein
VAVNDNYTNSAGEKVEKTTWVRVSTWGKTAETMNQYLHKGSRVLVIGRLVSDPKTGGPKIYTRTDGSAGASFEMTAFQVKFMSSKGEDEAHNAGAEGAADYVEEQQGDSSAASKADDIPF